MFQARRGLHREYPENTIPAILGAVYQGYSSVEVDVNLTKDGKVDILDLGFTAYFISSDEK